MKTSQWRRAVENRCVFSACLKALSDRSGDRSAGGRRFHVAGPLTSKLCCPVAVRVRGTSVVKISTAKQELYAMSLSFYMLIMQVIHLRSFVVCLLPTRTCRPLADGCSRATVLAAAALLGHAGPQVS